MIIIIILAMEKNEIHLKKMSESWEISIFSL